MNEEISIKVSLRHDYTPYALHSLACFLSILVLVYLTRGDWSSFFLYAWIMPAALILYIKINTQYKIWYSNGAVYMKASGVAKKRINYSDITILKFEENLEKGRPFKRISIYTEDGTFIDISIKHFIQKDIRALIDKIYVIRPSIKSVDSHNLFQN